MAQGLPPGLAGFVAADQDNQARYLNQGRGLAQLLAMQGALQEQAQRAQMMPLQLQQLQGQIAAQGGAEQLRQAQINDLQRKATESQRREAALGGLASLLARPFQGVEGQGSPAPTSVTMSEADALRQVQEAEAQGRPARVDVPAPGLVRGLAVAADPQRAIPEILKQERPEKPLTPRQKVTPVAGGYLEESGTFVRTAPEPAARPSEPLVPVLGADGKPTLLPRSEAAGRTPASVSGREDDQMTRRVLQFGTAMDKSGIPSSYANLQEASSLLAKPGVLNYLTGPGSLVPDAALSKDITDARQALQRVLNITLKDRSGAAVTNQEFERFKREAGVGILKKPDQIPEFLRQAKVILDKHYQGLAAGYPEEVRNRYFEESGRVAPFGAQGAAPGPKIRSSDQDLINRYLNQNPETVTPGVRG